MTNAGKKDLKKACHGACGCNDNIYPTIFFQYWVCFKKHVLFKPPHSLWHLKKANARVVYKIVIQKYKNIKFTWSKKKINLLCFIYLAHLEKILFSAILVDVDERKYINYFCSKNVDTLHWRCIKLASYYTRVTNRFK